MAALGSAPLNSLAISDDAQAILVGTSDGTAGQVWLIGGTQSPQPLLKVGVPAAMRFFDGTHNALVADRGMQQVALLTGIGQAFNFQVLAGAGLKTL